MGELKVVLVGVGGVGKSASTITYVSNIWISDYGKLLLFSPLLSSLQTSFRSFIFVASFFIFFFSPLHCSAPRCPLPPSVLHGRTLSFFL